MLAKWVAILKGRVAQILVVALICSGLSFHQAWVWRGKLKDAEAAAATAALNKQLDEAQAKARQAARQLIQQADAYAITLQEIEDAARSDPGASRIALPRDSVRQVFSIGE